MMTKEERAAYMKEYYQANKARLKRQRRAWYLKNADRISSARRIKYCIDPEFRKYELERSREYWRKKHGLA